MASSAMIIQSYTDHQHQTSFECCSKHQSGDVDCWLLYKPLRHIDCNLVGGQRRRQGDVGQVGEEEQEELHPACLERQHSQRKHTSRGVLNVDSCTVMFTKLYLSDPASGYNKGQLILTKNCARTAVIAGEKRVKKETKKKVPTMMPTSRGWNSLGGMLEMDQKRRSSVASQFRR